jgi:hypothetical protein
MVAGAVAALCLLALVADARPAMPHQLAASTILWPNVQGRAGAYDVGALDPSEVATAAADGLSQTALNTAIPAGTAQANAYDRYNFKYFDYYIVNQFTIHCGSGVSAGSSCAYYDNSASGLANQQTMLQALQTHLGDVSQDSRISAFTMLDDSPGLLPQSFLDSIANHVHTSNQTAVFPRPVVCGFGGYIDRDMNNTGYWSTDDPVFSSGLVNFHAEACDMVQFYPECYAGNTGGVCDWTLKSTANGNVGLLTRWTALLQQHGWNIANEPLIASAQSYYWTPAYDPAQYPDPSDGGYGIHVASCLLRLRRDLRHGLRVERSGAHHRAEV